MKFFCIAIEIDLYLRSSHEFYEAGKFIRQLQKFYICCIQHGDLFAKLKKSFSTLKEIRHYTKMTVKTIS